MKKLGLLIMPLMAISLLASCNNGGGDNPKPTPGTTYTLTFNCENCKAYDEAGQVEINEKIDVPVVGSYTTYCKFAIKGKEKYKAPFSKSSISVKKTANGESVDFDYNGKTCMITTPVIDNLTITISGVNKTLEQFSWAEISEISTFGRADEFFDIYNPEYPELNCKKVQLKHQDTNDDGADKISEGEPYQTVRIIGINEDYTELPTDGSKPNPDKAIGITFEFADLISDDQGYSIATQWNDTDDTDEETGSANHNYLDSSVRAALVGKKQKFGHILWAQKGATSWSNEPGGTYTDKSVLDMLPDELVKEGILKTPAKYINIYDNGWKEEIVKDKLFLLSSVEMGNTSHEGEEEHTTTYSYYDGAGKTRRVKKQIKGDERLIDSSKIPRGSGQSYLGQVSNYAGYNTKVDNTEGGFYLLRSPYTINCWGSCMVLYDGQITHSIVYYDARAIAPAFCI